jgi:hypothetical protein
MGGAAATPPITDSKVDEWRGRDGPILLQNSNVAGLRIIAINPKREAIADSYNLNRAAEVAYEFNVRR